VLLGEDKPVKELRRLCDCKDNGALYGLTWALRGGDPLLCVYGQTSLIKVYNTITGRLEQVNSKYQAFPLNLAMLTGNKTLGGIGGVYTQKATEHFHC
jgi:hypothetical protein